MPAVRLPEKNLFPSLEPIEGQKVEEEFDKITDESKLDSLLSKEPSKLDEILESSSANSDAPPKTITTVKEFDLIFFLLGSEPQISRNNKYVSK